MSHSSSMSHTASYQQFYGLFCRAIPDGAPIAGITGVIHSLYSYRQQSERKGGRTGQRIEREAGLTQKRRLASILLCAIPPSNLPEGLD